MRSVSLSNAWWCHSTCNVHIYVLLNITTVGNIGCKTYNSKVRNMKCCQEKFCTRNCFNYQVFSTRLLILQCVFFVGEVWPQLSSRFGNAIKVVACVQTSVPFRNAIIVYKNYVHLTKFIVSSTVAAHCRDVKIVMWASKKELEDWHKNRSEDREPKCNHYPMKSVSKSMSTKESSRG